jgi:hypothetical protein
MPLISMIFIALRKKLAGAPTAPVNPQTTYPQHNF